MAARGGALIINHKTQVKKAFDALHIPHCEYVVNEKRQTFPCHPPIASR